MTKRNMKNGCGGKLRVNAFNNNGKRAESFSGPRDKFSI